MRDTRAELLAEAEALVRGRGYSGFSYADLAEAVGIRKASIHHHFPTKSDLAVALLASYDERYDVALAAIRRDHGGGCDRLRAYGELYLAGVEKGLGCLCAAFAAELDTLPEALRQALAVFFTKHIRWLETILSEGRADGTVRADVDPPAAARLAVAALEGALMMERLVDGVSGFNGTLGALVTGVAPAPRQRRSGA